MKLSLASLSDPMLRRVTARVSVAVAAILILAKLIAFFDTGSVALLSSLVDSGVDLLASLITAYGVAKAAKPPDKEHRFGHGKAEALAALVQALFIAGSAIFLVFEAMKRFVELKPLENETTGYAVMGLAIILTAILLALQSYTIARTKSLAIASDRMHYIGDILINFAVVGTLFFQKQIQIFWIDPLFAILIAVGMFIGAFAISRRAIDVLMDAERPEKERTAIMAISQQIEGVHGAHDLRTRFDGDRHFIELHIEMDPETSLREAQNVSEAVSRAIQAKYKDADVQIHQDPVGLDEVRLDALIEEYEK